MDDIFEAQNEWTPRWVRHKSKNKYLWARKPRRGEVLNLTNLDPEYHVVVKGIDGEEKIYMRDLFEASYEEVGDED